MREEALAGAIGLTSRSRSRLVGSCAALPKCRQQAFPPRRRNRFLRRIPIPMRSPSPHKGGNAPGTMTYFVTHAQAAFAGQSKIVINEPSVGTNSNVVFVSSNLDAAYSTDRGNTFTFVDPTTTFPSVDNGFLLRSDRDLCPQHRNDDLATAVLGHCGEKHLSHRVCTGRERGHLRLVLLRFHPARLGQPAGANFDYPDMALSNNFVYFTARVFYTSGAPAPQSGASRLLRRRNARP